MLAALLLSAQFLTAQVQLTTKNLRDLPNYFYKRDSTVNVDTTYITQSKNIEKVAGVAVAFWQLHVEEQTDTTTFTITVEQATDISYTRWVETFTVDSTESTLGTDNYYFMVPYLGFKQRLKIVASGTNTVTYYYAMCKTVLIEGGYLPSYDGALLN